jgi:hypothetical protein
VGDVGAGFFPDGGEDGGGDVEYDVGVDGRERRREVGGQLPPGRHERDVQLRGDPR